MSDLIIDIEEYRKRNDLKKADMARLFSVELQNYNNWVYRGSLPKDYYPRAHELLGTIGTSEPASEYIAIPFRKVNLRATLDTSDGYEIQFENGEDDPEPLYYRRDWIRKRGYKVENLVARRISGSSMEPALFDGDKVLINMGSKTPKNGVVFWVIVDGHPCIKRLRKRGSEWWITSDNPAHSKTDQPLEALNQIIGEAVEKSSTNI